MTYQRELTKRQQEILDYIRGEVHRHGYPPSVREIGEAVGLSSSSTVHSHLAALEAKGFIRRDPSKPRALEVLDYRETDRGVDYGRVNVVPLVGQVAAGSPILAAENIESTMSLPAELAGEIHRGLATRRVGDLHRVHRVVGDHDGNIRRRSVRNRRRGIPRNTRQRVAGNEAVDPFVLAGRGEGIDGQHGGDKGRRSGVPAELLAEHGDLDGAETDSAPSFGDLDPEPALVGHRRPERRVIRGIGTGMGAHLNG